MASMKQQIVNYLASQGLQPSTEDFGIFFKYQMKNFWVLTYDDDEQYFRLIMPGIMDVDQNNRADVLEACNKVCADMKVAKCYISDNNDVWLACGQAFPAAKIRSPAVHGRAASPLWSVFPQR